MCVCVTRMYVTHVCVCVCVAYAYRACYGPRVSMLAGPACSSDTAPHGLSAGCCGRCVLCLLRWRCSVALWLCGSVAGVDDAGLRVKHEAVAAGLASNQALIAGGPLGVLQAVGGLELAAMAGALLEAARRSMPVLLDGFIAGAAALVALRTDPLRVRRSLFVTHQSAEAGAARLLAELACGEPVLQLRLRLGEGTGALVALPLLRSAAAIISDMASLADVMAAAAAPNDDEGNEQSKV